MTNEQINRAIAEACGWTLPSKHGTLYRTADGWQYDCPNFCHDLNAMHKAEETLTPNDWTAFEGHLYPAKNGHPLHFTARERAEAFLRALGKWATVNQQLTVQKEVQP